MPGLPNEVGPRTRWLEDILPWWWCHTRRDMGACLCKTSRPIRKFRPCAVQFRATPLKRNVEGAVHCSAPLHPKIGKSNCTPRSTNSSHRLALVLQDLDTDRSTPGVGHTYDEVVRGRVHMNRSENANVLQQLH